MKTTLRIHLLNHEVTEVESNITMDTMILALMEKIPVVVLDEVYSVERIMTIDLLENTIEIESLII